MPLQVTRGSQVAAGDFCGHGKTDLLIGSRFLDGYDIAGQDKDGVFRVRTEADRPGLHGYRAGRRQRRPARRPDHLVGDIFLRQPDGSLPDTPSFHLNTPAGELKGWVFLAAADFDHDGWTDVALLANGKEGTIVWLYRNTRNPRQPFSKEPSAKFVVPDADVNRDGPTVADWNGDGIPDLLLCKRRRNSRGSACSPARRPTG